MTSQRQWVHAAFAFFFNDTATTEIYTLSLHDALPIYPPSAIAWLAGAVPGLPEAAARQVVEYLGAAKQVLGVDRKSTRLNSSHRQISNAVFCLKKMNLLS